MAKPETTPPQDSRQRIVLVTGPSGAGRTTAINTLEDLGFEVIDNLPLSLLPRLLDGPPLSRQLAIGLDVRNRDFSIDAMIDTLSSLSNDQTIDDQVLYLDCNETELVRRYSETRRRHPLANAASTLTGIQREIEMLVPIRARANVVIDTTGLSVHDTRAEVEHWFAPSDGRKLSVTVQSFSFKRGLPRGLDLVHDVRFLRNPHWEPSLRALDGRDAAVAGFVAQDPLFTPFFDRLLDMTTFLLPAYTSKGKSHLSIGIGCTGGQHRSVALTEKLTTALSDAGWMVSKRHRELERKAPALTIKGQVA